MHVHGIAAIVRRSGRRIDDETPTLELGLDRLSESRAIYRTSLEWTQTL
jgi:hypothetical protein